MATLTEKDFENYSGNLRIMGVSFDGLAQMWEGNREEYDPKEAEPLAKFYIGKVGKYRDCSYIWNNYLRCASIQVTFANGYDVMVSPDDVVFTEDEMTWEEYLPKVPKPGEDTCIYKPLTDAQKEFADKLFLQMVTGCQHEINDKELYALMNRAINAAQYRTEMHSRIWDVEWLKHVDDED